MTNNTSRLKKILVGASIAAAVVAAPMIPTEQYVFENVSENNSISDILNNGILKDNPSPKVSKAIEKMKKKESLTVDEYNELIDSYKKEIKKHKKKTNLINKILN